MSPCQPLLIGKQAAIVRGQDVNHEKDRGNP